jgi:hypothetical protein
MCTNSEVSVTTVYSNAASHKALYVCSIKVHVSLNCYYFSDRGSQVYEV